MNNTKINSHINENSKSVFSLDPDVQPPIEEIPSLPAHSLLMGGVQDIHLYTEEGKNTLVRDITQEYLTTKSERK